MSAKRVTQRDIAEAAGVHQATVSLALKNHPSIPAETRERIQRLAAKLGYAPDPMLTALAKYRMQGQQQVYKGTLAWLVNCSVPDYNWRVSPHYSSWFEGAQAQARCHGFELEVVEYTPSKVKAARMASILRARGIQGILLCPLPEAFACMDFQWDDFSVVAFGSTLVAPRFHAVAIAHYQSVRQVYDVLRERGYRRIGCALSKTADGRCGNVYLSSFLGKHFLQDRATAATAASVATTAAAPVLYEEFGWEIDPQQIARWCRKQRLDAVISNNHLLHKSLEAGGLPAPEKIGAACPSLPDTDCDLSGIFESSVHIGEVAVDFLVGMIYRGERGVPRYPQRLSVEGLWHEGRTIRARNSK